MGKCVPSFHCSLYCFPLNASSSGHIHHSCHLFPVFFPTGPALYLHLGVDADQNIVLLGTWGGRCKWLAKVRTPWAYQPTERPKAQSGLQNYGMGGGPLSVTGNCHWPLHSDEKWGERDEWDSKTARERLSVLSVVFPANNKWSVMRELKSTRTRP